jgi:hypothetical protein
MAQKPKGKPRGMTPPPPPRKSYPRKGPTKAAKDGGLETTLKKKPLRRSQKVKGVNLQAEMSIGGKCGARTKGGTKCQHPAGYGTDHPQIGRCKYHGGSTINGVKNAIVQRAQLMGAPIDMNPVEAIIWSIRITAGEVKWLSEQIQELDEKDWHENTVIGKQMHLYVRERRDRVGLLYKMGNDALKLGLAERAVKMAEMYGVALSRFIMGVLEDLQLTPDQAQRAPAIVRKHLILLEGTRPVGANDLEVLDDVEFKEIAA